MKILFTTQIYAQSLLDFHARPGSGAYIVQQDTAINKHLNLLDGLALLLTRKQGDVVATSFRAINSRVVFYWAKNHNERLPTESAHISGLINRIRNNKKPKEILAAVINFSYGKIIHRCRKLGKQYGLRLGQLRYADSNLLNVNTSHPKYVELQKLLSERHVLYHEGSLVDHLGQLVRMIADIKSTAKTDKVAQILNHIWVLFSQKARLSDFIDSKDCNRWRKLADFLRTVLNLRHDIKMLEGKGIANFEFEQYLRRSHGNLKKTNGWALPDYDPIKPAFLDSLVQEIQRGYETCASGRRKSDSAPLFDQEFDPSGLEDVELEPLGSKE
ncbi:MAG: hypothetical protein LQ350_007062 [Teloschistes chrysophthalmus]|nr:MAG: hypothetical protein LQ350_007062 [Niorma chrysophthalma]